MKTITETKSVGFSYPTSSNAKRFGFDKSGCWTVSIMKDGGEKPVAGFATKAQAVAHAEAMPNAWDKYSSR